MRERIRSILIEAVQAVRETCGGSLGAQVALGTELIHVGVVVLTPPSLSDEREVRTVDTILDYLEKVSGEVEEDQPQKERRLVN